MESVFILDARRSPIGAMNGALSSIPAPRITAQLIRTSSESLGIPPADITDVILGQVLPAGVGQAPARQACLDGGLPRSTRTVTVNKVCGSGMQAMLMGWQALKLEQSQVVIAGGQENMSMAPHMLPGARQGYRFGPKTVEDHMVLDGLQDPFTGVPMGNHGESCSKKLGFTREEQDAFARSSYERSRKAQEENLFQYEITPIKVAGRRGQETLVEVDEGPQSVDLDKLSSLRPAFSKEGTVTAGNASTINDGAAILVLAGKSYVERAGVTPLAELVDFAGFAHEPESFPEAPIHATQMLLERQGLTVNDIDLFEINEAFACVTLASMRALEIPHEKVNVRGGAVSLGHPIGASGSRIAVTLVHALKKGQTGLASICIGGGEALACLLKKH